MVPEASTSHSYTGLELEATRRNSIGIERSEHSKYVDGGNLLPALPDDITINRILPRLPWRAMIKLTQLNHAWQTAVRSPGVQDVRARASTSQTIVTIHQYECVISLYDTVTESWHRLPRPPFGQMRFGRGCDSVTLHDKLCVLGGHGEDFVPPFGHMQDARGCGCVTLHGKLYVLGGNGEDLLPRDAVHMFELAGQGRWKQCASMKTPRKHFACGVYEGKIYVFGGIGAGNAAEVYDPKEDLWHDIAPMLTHRVEHRLVTIGDVFCIHMGRFLGSSCSDKLKREYAVSAEIYDPRKDHWTTVANFAIDARGKSRDFEVAEAFFVIDGKLHEILGSWLYVYEEPLNSGRGSQALRWDGSGSWKSVQPISWDVFTSPGAVNFVHPFPRKIITPISNNGELFALVFGQTGNLSNKKRWAFLKSQGLGSVDQKLRWEIIEGSACSTSPGWSSWRDDGFRLPFSPCISII